MTSRKCDVTKFKVKVLLSSPPSSTIHNPTITQVCLSNVAVIPGTYDIRSHTLSCERMICRVYAERMIRLHTLVAECRMEFRLTAS